MVLNLKPEVQHIFAYHHILDLTMVFLNIVSLILYSFHATIAAVFVLIYYLREFPSSGIINCFELRCQSKQLLLLYYKFVPVYTSILHFD